LYRSPCEPGRLQITGIYSTGIEEVDKQYVIGDLSLINRLNNWKPGEIGGYEVQLNDFDDINATANNVDNILPTKLKSFTVMENYAVIFGWLDLLDGNTFVVLTLMILVAVINMISALLIMIVERTTLVGMLKAMGASNWTIQKSVFIQCVLPHRPGDAIRQYIRVRFWLFSIAHPFF